MVRINTHLLLIISMKCSYNIFFIVFQWIRILGRMEQFIQRSSFEWCKNDSIVFLLGNSTSNETKKQISEAKRVSINPLLLRNIYMYCNVKIIWHILYFLYFKSMINTHCLIFYYLIFYTLHISYSQTYFSAFSTYLKLISLNWKSFKFS